MKLRIGRILITAFVVEVLTILCLVLLVALLGPPDRTAAQAYAQRLGYWVGPIAGFLFCLLGGWFVSRRLSSAHVLNGFVLSLVVAGIDISILIAGGAAFAPIFFVSNIGRIIAGSLGGWTARCISGQPELP